VHELSVCHALLDQVARVAAEHHAEAVSRIVLRVGPLAGVEPQLLAQAFPLARAGTVAADAELVVETAPVRVRCDTCGAETDAAVNRLVCGKCGDWRTKLVSGNEMLLETVELVTSEL
jgi:hydrogenase nickel incorporation protein HypA/HybF